MFTPDKVYFEPQALEYPLGKMLYEKYKALEWTQIQSHNNIEELRTSQNSDFLKMKRHIIIGVRKTHKYAPNHKTSDFLVPYTSSGCMASCLYCYLVCNYNKCSYLRLFVNREQMLDKIIKTANQSAHELTFEIGSNSDLVLENTITQNLEWTIEQFSKNEKGFITLPTKFDMIDPLLPLKHRGRTIIRMSLNPEEIIKKVEFFTSPLYNRLKAINKLKEAEYKIGILIAPIVLVEGWERMYSDLFKTMSDVLSPRVKEDVFFEFIFMTYSYIHRAINAEAFPKAIDLYDKSLMTGRGRGRYCYGPDIRNYAEKTLVTEFTKYFGQDKIMYIV